MMVSCAYSTGARSAPSSRMWTPGVKRPVDTGCPHSSASVHAARERATHSEYDAFCINNFSIFEFNSETNITLSDPILEQSENLFPLLFRQLFRVRNTNKFFCHIKTLWHSDHPNRDRPRQRPSSRLIDPKNKLHAESIPEH